MGAKSSLTMSWCTDQATVHLSKLRNLYDEAWKGLTGRFPKCTLAERVGVKPTAQPGSSTGKPCSITARSRHLSA